MPLGIQLANLTLNGLAFSVFLILVASGLSLIFGLMGVLNFAQGALYMLGAYVGLWLLTATHSFIGALLLASMIVGLVGLILERTMIRRFYGKHISQILLTFGLALIIEEVVRWIWGLNPKFFPVPAWMSNNPIHIGRLLFPEYRMWTIIIGGIVIVALTLLLRRTRFGRVVSAGMENSEMVEALGINVYLYFMLTFGLGVALAAFAGVIAGGLLTVDTAMGLGVTIDAFIVVVIGGLGSFPGSILAGLLVGMSKSFGSYYLGPWSSIVVFAVMIVVLLVRPHGLFGRSKKGGH